MYVLDISLIQHTLIKCMDHQQVSEEIYHLKQETSRTCRAVSPQEQDRIF